MTDHPNAIKLDEGAALTGESLEVARIWITNNAGSNVLIDAASHGARYGTLADRGPADAQERTRELITGSVGARFAGDVTAVPAEVQGTPTLEVRVVAPLPIVGPFGPPGAIEVSGHAVDLS